MTIEAEREIIRLLKGVQLIKGFVEKSDVYQLELAGQKMLDIYGNLISHFSDAQEQFNLKSVILTDKEEKTTDATKKAKASPEHKEMVKLELYLDLAKRQHDYIKKLLANKSNEHVRSSN